MTSARTYGLQVGIAVVLVLGSLWAATQWAAAMLGYQTALGTPWLDLLGLKIYAPWRLFAWWLAFESQAPDVFARAGAVAAFGGLASGAVAIGEPPGGRAARLLGGSRFGDGSGRCEPLDVPFLLRSKNGFG